MIASAVDRAVQQLSGSSVAVNGRAFSSQGDYIYAKPPRTPEEIRKDIAAHDGKVVNWSERERSEPVVADPMEEKQEPMLESEPTRKGEVEWLL